MRELLERSGTRQEGEETGGQVLVLPLKREPIGRGGTSVFVRVPMESPHRRSPLAECELRSCVNTIADVIMQLIPELYERNKDKHAEIILQQLIRLRGLLAARERE